jgi:hypothetical protein
MKEEGGDNEVEGKGRNQSSYLVATMVTLRCPALLPPLQVYLLLLNSGGSVVEPW